jgi:hypothetical protein
MTTPFEKILADAGQAYDLAAARTAKQIAALDQKAEAIRAELAIPAGSTPFMQAGKTDRGSDFALSIAGNK